LKGVQPPTVGERLIGLWFDGEHEGGELELLVDAQPVLLHQLAANVPEGGHIRIDQKGHV